MWLLLLLTLAPGIGLSVFIYWKDKYEREPRDLLIKSFTLGMFSCIPAIILSLLFESAGMNSESSNLVLSAFSNIIGIGLSEEFSKFIFVRFYTFRKKEFNEPFDGITYCVMVAAGFATAENVMYVANNYFENGLSGGFTVAIMRMIFSVPGHVMFGVIMGFFLGIEKHYQKPNYGIIGLLLAAVAHGLFDFCLFSSSQYPIFLIFFLILFVLIVILSLKAIKLHQQESPYK
ncbi:MAG: PrsW family intramembrane metalloprotease [Bacteroidota bacterium]|jgi:RsiW-degrading membrane proteinase PrsW (M82 family)